MFNRRLGAAPLAVMLAANVTMAVPLAVAASGAEINRDVDAALASLYAQIPTRAPYDDP